MDPGPQSECTQNWDPEIQVELISTGLLPVSSALSASSIKPLSWLGCQQLPLNLYVGTIIDPPEYWLSGKSNQSRSGKKTQVNRSWVHILVPAKDFSREISVKEYL